MDPIEVVELARSLVDRLPLRYVMINIGELSVRDFDHAVALCEERGHEDILTQQLTLRDDARRRLLGINGSEPDFTEAFDLAMTILGGLRDGLGRKDRADIAMNLRSAADSDEAARLVREETGMEGRPGPEPNWLTFRLTDRDYQGSEITLMGLEA